MSETAGALGSWPTVLELFLETANSLQYKMASRTVSFDGILTTPASLAALKQEPLETLEKLEQLLSGKQKLFVQIVETEYSKMLAEAVNLSNLNDDIILQMPATKDGLQVLLASERLDLHFCAICTSALQALFAARNGAEYVEFYLNQMLDYTQPIEIIEETRKLFAAAGLSAKILVSSFRNAAQIQKAFLAGADAAAISFDLFSQMVQYPLSNASASQFSTLWFSAFDKHGFYQDPLSSHSKEDLQKLAESIS